MSEYSQENHEKERLVEGEGGLALLDEKHTVKGQNGNSMVLAQEQTDQWNVTESPAIGLWKKYSHLDMTNMVFQVGKRYLLVIGAGTNILNSLEV